MKKIYISSLILLISLTSLSQTISIGVMGGYATYQNDDLKANLRENMIPSLDNEKVVKDYPSNLNFSTHFEYSKNAPSYFGLILNFNATGGKVHIEDYSGEHYVKHNLKNVQLGLTFRETILTIPKLKLSGLIEIGHIITNLEENGYLKILDFIDGGYTKEYKSSSQYIAPYLNLEYALTKKLLFNVNLGYQLDFNEGKFEDKEDDTLYLRTRDNVYPKPNWSGFRSRIGIAYRFKLK